MQIHKIIRLVDNVYHVEVGIPEGPKEDAFTAVEWEAISQLGQPNIEVGGEFDNGAGLVFSLTEKTLQFPSQFPVKQLFDRSDYADAEERANLFRDTIIIRLDAAITDLKSINSEVNVSDEIETVNTSD